MRVAQVIQARDLREGDQLLVTDIAGVESDAPVMREVKHVDLTRGYGDPSELNVWFENRYDTNGSDDPWVWHWYSPDVTLKEQAQVLVMR